MVGSKSGVLLEVSRLGSAPSLSDLRERQSPPAFSVEEKTWALECGLCQESEWVLLAALSGGTKVRC